MTSDPPLADICRTFGLPAPGAATRLPHGMMNRNWRIATADGREYAVKELRDTGPDQARTQHGLLKTLAEHGIPVAVPVTDPVAVAANAESNTRTPPSPIEIRVAAPRSPASSQYSD